MNCETAPPMPGITPMATPIALARSVSDMCANVSRTPCMTPAIGRFSPARAMLPLVIINCSDFGAAEEPDDNRHDVDAFPQVQAVRT